MARPIELRLTVRDIRENDLAGLVWAGSPLHLRSMAEQMRKNGAVGKVFLAAFLPTGHSVGKAEVK